ncbi:YciI family protein [Herbiconiux sp. UC225_62]|uniref:YciI family protein n=1 Tax=Herbiconiux sp. UC225_62 TaxID=3350168 RepID=UPI0036D38739
MGLFAVQYEYSTADVEGRQLVRPDHAAYLRGLEARRILVFSGPYPDGTGALLMLRSETEDECRSVLDSDPFARAGLVHGRRISPFLVGLGLPEETDRVAPASGTPVTPPGT